jgi:hypothetical protein
MGGKALLCLHAIDGYAHMSVQSSRRWGAGCRVGEFLVSAGSGASLDEDLRCDQAVAGVWDVPTSHKVACDGRGWVLEGNKRHDTEQCGTVSQNGP